MSFRVAPRTLERLEWAELVERLAGCARTPGGAARARGSLFEADAASVRERLSETSEARALLSEGGAPPTEGVRDLDASLLRLAKGGALGAGELLDVASTAAALAATARFLAARAERVPRLAALGAGIVDPSALADAIGAALEPDGTVRDAASPVLARARREARELAAEAQHRIERLLRDADVAGALSDSYFTVRNDRYVLPVRAESRARVPGIVHDASASGGTLYVEPEALVDVNNRHKQAELAIARETQRVLRELSERVADARGDLVAGLDALDAVDLAFARGRLSAELDAVEPDVRDAGVVRLPLLRHPLLGPEAVPNDLVLGEGTTVLVISGPNAGGKTVALKALALAVLLVRAGLHVPAARGARVDVFDAVLADIGDAQDLREHLSTFSAHVANLAEIARAADARALVALDEVGVGTDPSEGSALAQAVLEELADRGARVVATTHYNLLKEMAEVDPRFANASVEFDPETLAPTYRLRLGAAGSSSALAVAARMGMPASVLARADALLEREDRRLDRMLAELQASRAALERERSEAVRLRAESEVARDDYRAKLERLQARRDKLFGELRADLDRAFRDAHAQVAAVIHSLQQAPSARDAARARERLLALRARADETAARAAEPAASGAEGAGAPLPAADEGDTELRFDWSRARPGDRVTLPGGRAATVVALPDRRGRARVLVGTARLEIPADQVRPAAASASRPAAREPVRVRLERAPEPAGGPAAPLDLRGLRVDEALTRLERALDDAALRGRARLAVVHGLGTGALRAAVREHLARSPYVVRLEDPEPSRAGDGASVAVLRED
jgi:DNA mismatch repair protein MutS2